MPEGPSTDPERFIGHIREARRWPPFEEVVRAERLVQDACWGPEHDKAHYPGDWTGLIEERVQRLHQPMPVIEPAVRIARYRRLMIEIAALAAVAYDVVKEV